MPFNLQSERRGSTSIYVLKSSPKHTCYITSGLDSGGSRISVGGVDLRRGCFSAKMYVKTKEFGPVGGSLRPARPPRSANARYVKN